MKHVSESDSEKASETMRRRMMMRVSGQELTVSESERLCDSSFANAIMQYDGTAVQAVFVNTSCRA